MSYDLFEKALTSEFGISISCDHPGSARSLRRRLYYLRDRERLRGEQKCDVLSIVIRDETDVWIVNRSKIAIEDKADYTVRDLDGSEIPTRVRSRGRSRFAFHRIP